MENLEGSKQHGRPRDREDDNIKMDSKKTGCEGANCKLNWLRVE